MTLRRRMVAFLGKKAAELVQSMAPDATDGHSIAGTLEPHYDAVRYQSTHNTGGAIMGTYLSIRLSTPTSRCGTSPTSSSSARRPFRRTPVSIPPVLSPRSRTVRPTRSWHATGVRGRWHDSWKGLDDCGGTVAVRRPHHRGRCRRSRQAISSTVHAADGQTIRLAAAQMRGRRCSVATAATATRSMPVVLWHA